MFNEIERILIAICIVFVFTAQTYRPDDKDQRDNVMTRHDQIRQEPQRTIESPRKEAPKQEPPQQEAPKRDDHRQQPPEPPRQFEPNHEHRTGPIVYGVVPPVEVDNNRLLHRHHHNDWKPRYNFYDNQYHFYPYINIASLVDLSGGYIVVGPDGQNYYYDQGTFYLQDGGQYIAVAPPVGIIVNPIADGARHMELAGQIYYRYKGVFYIQVQQGYQVIGPVEYVPDGT